MRTVSILLAATGIALSPVQQAAAQDAVPLLSENATRLDLSVTGKTTRVPDIAIISAGVQTQAATASEALRQNNARMQRVIAALRDLGIEERDIRTDRVDLNPRYDYEDRQSPRLTGYMASNSVSVKFREIEMTGRILDILVAEGANQLNGPQFILSEPQEAQDEARLDALRLGRERAETYAAALGKRVVRLAMVAEGGGSIVRPESIVVTGARMSDQAASVPIEPGEQEVGLTLRMSFDLE